MRRLPIITLLLSLALLGFSVPSDAAACLRCKWEEQVYAYVCDFSANAPPNSAEWGTDCQVFDYLGWTFCSVQGQCGYDPGSASSFSERAVWSAMAPHLTTFLTEAVRQAEENNEQSLRLSNGGLKIHGRKKSPNRQRALVN